MSGKLGGHRLIDSSITPGKLKDTAQDEVLNRVAFIFPYDVLDVDVTSGTSSFTVTITENPAASFKGEGIVCLSNSYETVPKYANVSLLYENGDPVLSGNLNPLWGRVTNVSGSGTYTYTIDMYNSLDREASAPTPATIPYNNIPVVVLPYRKPLSQLDQLDLFEAGSGTVATVTQEELGEINNRVIVLENNGLLHEQTPSGVMGVGNYSFALTYSPISGSTELNAYGLCLTEGLHYNISGSTLTYVAGFEPINEPHRIRYRYLPE